MPCYKTSQNPIFLGADFPIKAPKENSKPPKRVIYHAEKNPTPDRYESPNRKTADYAETVSVKLLEIKVKSRQYFAR